MSQQSLLQASIRAITGTQNTFEGDWHALFDLDGVPAGMFDGRLLRWINLQLGSSYTNLPEAQGAYATAQGAYNWSSLGSVLWSPLLLGSALKAWWDPSRNVTHAEGVVSAWTDRVGAAALSQSTSGARPVYGATALSGSPGVTFDGTDDFLELVGVPVGFPTGSAAGWLFALADQAALASDASVRTMVSYGSSGASALRALARTVISSVNRARVGDNSVTAVDAAVDYSGVHAHLGVFTASLISGRVDGRDYAGTAAALATTTTRVRVGAGSLTAASTFWNGVAGHLLVGSGTLATSDKEKLEAWALWSCGQQSKLPANHPYRNRRP